MGAFDGMEEILPVFRAEAGEQLHNISEVLLKLEHAPAGDERRTLAVSAFRSAHNVKGAAGSLGMARLTAMVHALEDVLAGIREGQLAPDGDRIDLLLRTVDALQGVTASTQPGDEQLNDDDRQVIAALAASRQASAADREQRVPAAAAGRPGAAPATPTAPASGPATEPDADENTAAWVRVSRQQLDVLTAQLGELAETRIRMTSTARRLEAQSAQLKALNDAEAKPVSRVIRQLARNVTQDADELGKTISGMQADLKELRTVRFDTIFHGLQRAVRDACRARGVQATVTLEGGELGMDRSIVEALRAPLLHLLRNAVAHGVEPAPERQAAGKPACGTIQLRVSHQGSQAAVEVIDDGRGIDFAAIERRAVELGRWQASTAPMTDQDRARLLLGSGVSTAHTTDTVAGRGVGMGAVSQSIDGLDGRIAVHSEPGRGTRFVLTLPLTLAAERGVFVLIGQSRFAFPRTTVSQVLSFRANEVTLVNGLASLWRGEHQVPLARIDEALRVFPLTAPPPEGTEQAAVLVTSALRQVVFTVDEVEGEGEIVSRTLGTFLKRLPGVAAVTTTENGMCTIVNAADLVAAALRPASASRPGAAGGETGTSPAGLGSRGKLVLVVDDSVTSRLLHERMLTGAGYAVVTAANGAAALATLRAQPCDVVLTDAQMPEMDGFDLASAIKADPALAGIPVILLTALGGEADKHRGLEAGADAYLLKRELNQRELIQTIEQLA